MRKAVAPAVFLILSLLFAFQAFADPSFPLDINEVNSFDRYFMVPYDNGGDILSNVLSFAAAATPAVLLSRSADQYVTIGLMYAEAMATTFLTKEIVKHFVYRERPYMYFADTPRELVVSGKHDDSFFSGHTAYAFTAASFASYVFSKYNPESAWRIPVTVASFSLASAAAAYRVASGSHFMTDVLAGAAIGTVIGIVVPALHTLFADKDASVSVSPFGLVFSKRY